MGSSFEVKRSTHAITVQPNETVLTALPYGPHSSLLDFLRGEPRVLGAVQILLALIIVSVGTVFAFNYFSYSQRFPLVFCTGYPFWGALIFVITGYATGFNRKDKCLGKRVMAMNVISSLAAVAGIVLTLFSFQHQHQYCGAPSIEGICAIGRILFSGILSVLLIISLVELSISVTLASFRSKCWARSNEIVFLLPLGATHESELSIPEENAVIQMDLPEESNRDDSPTNIQPVFFGGYTFFKLRVSRNPLTFHHSGKRGSNNYYTSTSSGSDEQRKNIPSPFSNYEEEIEPKPLPPVLEKRPPEDTTHTEQINDDLQFAVEHPSERQTQLLQAEALPLQVFPSHSVKNLKVLPLSHLLSQALSAETLIREAPTHHITQSRDLISKDMPAQDIPSQYMLSQVQVLPTQALLSKVPIPHITQSYDLTSEDMPSQDIPSQNTQSQDIPSQDMPSQNRLSQVQVLPKQALLSKVPIPHVTQSYDLTSEDMPSQDIPSQNTQSQDIPSQDLTSEDMPSQDIPSQNTQSQDIPSQDMPSQNKLSQFYDLISEDMPSQDIPSQNTQSQDMASQGMLSQVQVLPIKAMQLENQTFHAVQALSVQQLEQQSLGLHLQNTQHLDQQFTHMSYQDIQSEVNLLTQEWKYEKHQSRKSTKQHSFDQHSKDRQSPTKKFLDVPIQAPQPPRKKSLDQYIKGWLSPKRHSIDKQVQDKQFSDQRAEDQLPQGKQSLKQQSPNWQGEDQQDKEERSLRKQRQHKEAEDLQAQEEKSLEQLDQHLQSQIQKYQDWQTLGQQSQEWSMQGWRNKECRAQECQFEMKRALNWESQAWQTQDLLEKEFLKQKVLFKETHMLHAIPQHHLDQQSQDVVFPDSQYKDKNQQDLRSTGVPKEDMQIVPIQSKDLKLVDRKSLCQNSSDLRSEDTKLDFHHASCQSSVQDASSTYSSNVGSEQDMQDVQPNTSMSSTLTSCYARDQQQSEDSD
nr:membrane-spanning 4-domains subfamily A member 14 [Desmodus rotundus]